MEALGSSISRTHDWPHPFEIRLATSRQNYLSIWRLESKKREAIVVKKTFYNQSFPIGFSWSSGNWVTVVFMNKTLRLESKKSSWKRFVCDYIQMQSENYPANESWSVVSFLNQAATPDIYMLVPVGPMHHWPVFR